MRKISASSRIIPATGSISPAAFSAFGEIIQNPLTHGEDRSRLQSVVANQGSATKWLDVTHMDNHYPLAPSEKPAKAVVNMFVCKPRKLEQRQGKSVFPVEILERHPYTPQTFIPLGVSPDDRDTRYLVIVAPTLAAQTHHTSGKSERAQPPKGTGDPDLNNIRAFIVRGDQAVTYGPGTWHAPMVVLGGKAIDFVVVQYANGVGPEDCQEVQLDGRDDGGHGLAVAVGEAELENPAAPGIMRAKL